MCRIKSLRWIALSAVAICFLLCSCKDDHNSNSAPKDGVHIESNGSILEQQSTNNSALDEELYLAAEQLFNEGEYEKAAEAFAALGNYKDSAERSTDAYYHCADQLLQEGKLAEAANAFDALGDYQDSSERVKNYLLNRMGNPKIGDKIVLGAYEQNNNTSDGKEEIKWLVLAKEKDRILVISEFALDCKPYNIVKEDVTWETCYLREWLNDEFWNSAFISAEQQLILTTTVPARYTDRFSPDPGNETQDKLFVIDSTEAVMYFKSEIARECKPSAFAVAQGTYKTGSTCMWWLRSPGLFSNDAAVVGGDGYIYNEGSDVNVNDTAVRPAMWIMIPSGG